MRCDAMRRKDGCCEQCASQGDRRCGLWEGMIVARRKLFFWATEQSLEQKHEETCVLMEPSGDKIFPARFY
jgi:hypothetical protein